MSSQLINYDAACAALAAAKATDEVQEIRNSAAGMEAYARQAKNRELEADAAEIRMRAERRLGELIILQKETVGLAKPGPKPKFGSELEPNYAPTLAEAGIDKKLSSRAQKMAGIAADEFEGIVEDWREKVIVENDRVVKNILKTSEVIRKREAYTTRRLGGGSIGDLSDLGRFGVIYADPPWSFKVYSGKGKQRSAERHYDTMSLDDICALPIAPLALEDCALFMWAVMPELPGALRVIEAWGFEYKTCAFTWVKQNRSGDGLFTGMGYWTRANAEVCLLATKGSPFRLAKDVPQVIMAPVSEHSRKPDEARKRIMRLLGGPYLELFGRQTVTDWTVWGNEI